MAWQPIPKRPGGPSSPNDEPPASTRTGVSRQLEDVLPFPVPRERIPLATRFRSTWLYSSIRALRSRNLIDAYLKLLPAQFHDPIFNSVAGSWLPVEVAEEHYKACDGLRLDQQTILDMGRETVTLTNSTILSLVSRVAVGSGATPWTALSQGRAIWERTWVGGGVSLLRAGPKDGVFLIAGWSCARYSYIRVAFRGVIQAIIAQFCTKAYVTELPRECTPTTLGYRFSYV